MQFSFVALSIVSAQIGLWLNLKKFSPKKCFFHLYNSKSPVLSLPVAAKLLKMTFTGGNPWPFYIPTNPFGRFAAFSGSWGIWFKSNFTLKKHKDFQLFFFEFGQQNVEICAHN